MAHSKTVTPIEESPPSKREVLVRASELSLIRAALTQQGQVSAAMYQRMMTIEAQAQEYFLAVKEDLLAIRQHLGIAGEPTE